MKTVILYHCKVEFEDGTIRKLSENHKTKEEAKQYAEERAKNKRLWNDKSNCFETFISRHGEIAKFVIVKETRTFEEL